MRRAESRHNPLWGSSENANAGPSDDLAEVPPNEIGACVTCGRSTRRFGDHGNPKCATCRGAA